MSLEFYMQGMSPNVRPTWMAIEELGIQYEAKEIKVLQGENKTEEYKAINYIQKIPAIKDGDFCMAESRAIMAYLCNKHEEEGKASALYPRDPKARAMVDSCMYRDLTDRTNVANYLNIVGAFQRGEKDLDKEKLPDVKKYLDALEGFLGKHKYIAADHLTIADFTVYSTVMMLTMSEEFETMDDYPKITEWRSAMAQLPYHAKTCEEPMAMLKGFYRKARGLE